MNRIVATSCVGISLMLAAVAVWPSGLAATPASLDAYAEGCCHAESTLVSVKHTLTLDGATAALNAAAAKARERSASSAIAVVDDGGNLVALQRLDGTFAAAATVSIGKARTAALFKKPTRAFEESINNGRTALTAVDEMTPLQGGVPILHDGHVVGAIGVSGAHSQQEDEEIALAGAAAVADSPSLIGGTSSAGR